jgi:hypothetical protein
MTNEYKEISNLDVIIDDAKKNCEGQELVYNMILRYAFDSKLTDHPFEDLFLEQALKWQRPQEPKELHFNHGRYIHRYGDGIKYLVDQLKNKRNGNRAIISLINMKDIIHSEDCPIPSFMVSQAGINDTNLYFTTYFRALEVFNFLPINITEICLIIREIKREIVNIKRVYFCLHTFRAYYLPEFDCLKRAEIDRLEPGIISSYLHAGDKERIRGLLKSKMKASSVIEIGGIQEIYFGLKNSRESTRGNFSDEFLVSIEKALEILEKLREVREHSSHGDEINRLTNNFKERVTEAIDRL